MRITPAEAAIIGTSLGATGTLTAAWMTQRATARRERERRLWDRRTDTYADLMTTIHVLAQDRARTEHTGERPDDQSRTAAARESAGALAARVELYSSEHLRSACERSFTCTDIWVRAWEEWHQRGTGVRLKSPRDRKWQTFTERVAASQEADSRLLGLLLADVHGERAKRKKRRLRRLLGIRVTVTTARSVSQGKEVLAKKPRPDSDHG
ncbi:hypothetical protein OG223_19205 [Streptomyces sp. NBC_01478]|uniref:hypothetical protein n=1 Tax=Streptomyces sp. NBC_01478 TaxID=2903882 RepID=UPI002E34C9DA|nr:hypothetical protein [Streptomyces sp. NBC_01478]